MSLAVRLAEIRERIDEAAAGRTVELVGVSKRQPPAAIEEAVGAGLLAFGENYAQELDEKRRTITDPRIRWHMVGPIQSNKAKLVTGCALIHTVDRPSLVAALDRRAEQTQHVLIQVNVDAEPGKSGIAPAALPELLDAFAACSHLECRGLMLIPRLGTAAELRSQFRALRRLRDEHAARARPRVALAELSMGMSDDFVLAIEEGATLVRIGTAIFGARHA